MSLLELTDFSIQAPAGAIVSGLDLSLRRGERLGLVGESGSGKSMTALALMGLLPDGLRATGSLRFDGAELTAAPEAQWRRLRGRRMAMIFQEPMTALNPIKSIGAQVAEGRRLHFGESRAEAETRARALLDRVGLPAPRFDAGLYPHQLSGGQRQRVMIAIAIACGPELLVADEPTTALDVTVQAQILDLLDELAVETGMALLLISHDLGVVAEMTDRVAVLYAGRVVETGRTETVFRSRAHPYTRALFAASPYGARAGRKARLSAIPGRMPEPGARPPFCAFAERCAFAEADCRREVPALRPVGEAHRAACLHPRKEDAA